MDVPAEVWLQASVDRIVDGVAVLLVGEQGEQWTVAEAELPPEARREGVWLRVHVAGGSIVRVETDPDETERAQARVRAKLDRLRQRGRGGSQPEPTSP